jgi:hypothetical protein
VKSGPNIFTEQEKIFPQVKLGPEFIYPCLAASNLVFARRLTEPGRKRRLTRAGTSTTNKLKEGSLTEYVEIRRIRMVRVHKALPCFARSRPSAGKSVQRTFVEIFRPRGERLLTRDPFMNNEQRHERSHRDRQQPVVPPGDKAAEHDNGQPPNA